MAWRRLTALPRMSLRALPAVSLGVNIVNVKRVACSSANKEDEKPADKQADYWISGVSQGCNKTLPCTFDLYGGVMVDPATVPAEQDAFRTILASSLDEWMKRGKQGVWLRLDISAAALVPIAISEFGFEYHHAERDYVMMTKWLPSNCPNTLPHNASHTIGVGALVTNSEGKILLAREKSGPAARSKVWKIPTGLVDAGEDLHEAALREVKEETGIDATFEYCGAFTMSHGGNLAHANKSNLFFVVKCKALTTEIQLCESEIADARWFSKVSASDVAVFHCPTAFGKQKVSAEEEWLTRMEKGSIWYELNQSALDAEAVVSMKSLPWGRSRPGVSRLFFCPVRRSAL
ncbi:unnamed protein product [Durusdinium trenchii]|uniref:Nudix hydrolase domain-containing protein n=2 Tax=Durusdinium trenchii TaxID=1381693 RepID=A0ABP0MIY2_9DINO